MQKILLSARQSDDFARTAMHDNRHSPRSLDGEVFYLQRIALPPNGGT